MHSRPFSIAVGLVLLANPIDVLAQDGMSSSAFDGADANHDGKISKPEFLAARTQKFDSIDKNHDGVINRGDFPRAANHQRALAAIDAHIASADANHDGAISRAELSQSATPFFDRADANHDGFVTRAESNAVRQAAQARRQ